MQALVISDTHGRCENLERLLKKYEKLDMIFHLGDVEGDEDYIASLARNTVHAPVIFVRGNMDFCCDSPSRTTVAWGGHLIYMTHGHLQGVHSGYEVLLAEAKENQADVVLFGHTHLPHLSYEDGILLMNPGSLSKPRQAGWKPAFALLEVLKNGEIYPTLATMRF